MLHQRPNNINYIGRCLTMRKNTATKGIGMTNVKKTRKRTTWLISNIRDCKKPTTELLVYSVEQDHTKSGYLIYGHRTLPFTFTVVLQL